MLSHFPFIFRGEMMEQDNLLTRCFARQTPWSDEVQIVIRRRDGAGVSFASRATFVRAEADNMGPVEPIITLAKDEAQMLMDELWQCGLRPSEGTGSAGALAATQRHLEDMRAIVANVLNLRSGNEARR